MLDITRDKPVKVSVKVAVPVRDHPKFNFVGKLLGPKGNSMKRLQEDTMCKMAVLGRGSMRDRKKEEELRASGDARYAHLFEDLHVEITTFAAPAEAHARIAYALAEVRRFLVPDYHDDIRQEQMWEMQALTSSSSTPNGTATPNTGSTSSHLDEQQNFLLLPQQQQQQGQGPLSPNSQFRNENHVPSDMETCNDDKSELVLNDCTSATTSTYNVIEGQNNNNNNSSSNSNTSSCNSNGASNYTNSIQKRTNNNNNNQQNVNNNNSNNNMNGHQIFQQLLQNRLSNANTCDFGLTSTSTSTAGATTAITIGGDTTTTITSPTSGDNNNLQTAVAAAAAAAQASVVSIHPAAMAVAALQHQLTAAGIGNMLKPGATPTFTHNHPAAALPTLTNDADTATAAAAAAAAITPSVASTLGLLDSNASVLHPALRGVKAINIAGAMGRKRPLLGVPRTTMNPTKRTVMTLLARAKNAQTLQTVRPVNAATGTGTTTFADPLQMLASPFILSSATHHNQATMDQSMINLTKKNLAQSV